MDLVKVQSRFFNICTRAGADPHNQLLHNESGRPCVLIIKLKYRGKLRDFVVPLKSNITSNTDCNDFFALPPNKKTRPGNYHGVYDVKLFPVHRRYLQPYLIEGDKYLEGVKQIIDNNERSIIEACQKYLNEYEAGNRNYYTPEIDLIIEQIEKMKI